MPKRKLTKQEKRLKRLAMERQTKFVKDSTSEWLGQFSPEVRDYLLTRMQDGLERHGAGQQ